MLSLTYDLDPDRENRIAEEVLVDTYDLYEVIAAWFTYLEDRLSFPFQAHWGDPDNGDTVMVRDFDEDNECDTNVFMKVVYDDGEVEDEISILLTDLFPIDADEESQRAIADWHYWVAQGNLESFDEDNDDEY
ncbi:calcium-binding protein [Prochlorothrix hollandica]|uniref:Calcium-binding protein n=1 Tax=Prochlorothrix hollandica PCC 9006 = CALU 1027 TaxID=317619 RepID=A0A0M2PUS9_PROHO|nr:calcium-binding protein [Prochlorothrix hollandica]KKI98146.1 hypothetical protein PROH_20850 [Prochlorothrix hollandica PCC 9006 = CALU 1027]